MSTNPTKSSRPSWLRLSLDGWAVTAAFFLVALIRLGLLKRVPW
ncbi:MAG: hypothetical protein ACE14M_12565 [Terriglobales bacterium]